jgi:hypothetical protein
MRQRFLSCSGRASTEVGSCLPFVAETRFRSHGCSCGIYAGQSGTVTSFWVQCLSVSFHQCFILHILFTYYRRRIILAVDSLTVLWIRGNLRSSEFLFYRIL